MASFIQTGDPNLHKVTNSSIPGIPNVEEGKQFLVTASGLRQGGINALEERCKYWAGVSQRVPV
jgi:hypothetical protein